MLSSNVRRFLLAGICSTALSFPADAGRMTLLGAGSAGVAVAYTGPGDVVASATTFWGLRGYSAAYSTGSNPAAVVCNAATFTTCSTINILSNGNFDTATASGSAACASTCVVKSLTDQTGGGATASCTSAATCPTLTFNCIGALPCMTFAAGQFFTATVTNLSQPYTWVGEFKYTSTAAGGIAGSGNGAVGWEPQNTALQYYGSTPNNVTAAVNTQYDWSVVFNATSSVSNLGGSAATTGGTGGTAAYGTTTFLLGEDFYNLYTGQLEEFGTWASALTPTQQTNLHTNLSTYW